MGEPVSLSLVRTFFEAHRSRDVARIAPLLADDVEWVMPGPVGVYPFCGYRRGKPAVLRYVCQEVPGLVDVIRSDVEHVVIDGDTVGALSRIAAVQRGTGRTIAYSCAYFAQFGDGRLTSLHGVTDSFSIAEQVFARRIDAFGVPDLEAKDDGLVQL